MSGVAEKVVPEESFVDTRVDRVLLHFLLIIQALIQLVKGVLEGNGLQDGALCQVFSIVFHRQGVKLPATFGGNLSTFLLTDALIKRFFPVRSLTRLPVEIVQVMLRSGALQQKLVFDDVSSCFSILVMSAVVP